MGWLLSTQETKKPFVQRDEKGFPVVPPKFQQNADSFADAEGDSFDILSRDNGGDSGVGYLSKRSPVQLPGPFGICARTALTPAGSSLNAALIRTRPAQRF